MSRLEIATQLLAAHLSRGNGHYAENNGLLSNAFHGFKSEYNAEKHHAHLKFLAQTALQLARYVQDGYNATLK